jgi:Pyruvate/2-oxoacid:ferredoxin oxidoreductase delta subunit
MTDILIDMTNKRRYKVNRCHYCNHDKYPDGKIIDPSDKYARHTDKGDWKCGICVNEESKKLIDMMSGRIEREQR